MKAQQIEIEKLEQQIMEQERLQQQEDVYHEQEKYLSKRRRGKGVGLLRILRARHQNGGNLKEVGQLNAILKEKNQQNKWDDLLRKKPSSKWFHKPEKIVLIPNLRGREY